MILGYTTNSLIPRLNKCVGYLRTNRDPKELEPTFLRCLRSIGLSLRTKGQTVNGKFYSTQVISAAEKRYIERRPKLGARGIKLLHDDNASSHKTK